MEHDLGRAEHIQPPISINGTIGAEGLHHGLLTGLSVVHMVNDHIAPGQHSVDITIAAFIMSAEVALVVGAHGARLSQLSSGCTRIGLSFAVWKSSTASNTS